MNNRKTPISATISIVGTITFIGCVIIGFFYGIAYGIEGSQNAKAFGGVIGVLFGMLLRMGVGFLSGLPIASILWGFAKIVAWYEAVPPGYAYGMQPMDDGSAPAARPMTYAPVPAKPATVKRDSYAATWKCTCGAENPVSRGTCDSCGGAKPFQRSRLNR